MAAGDVAPVVARIVADLLEVPGIGLVFDHDVWDRDDLAPLIVTNIAGANVVRCWWVTGPTLEATYRTNQGDGYLERRWTYTVHGIAGDPDGDGTGVNVLRGLGVAVTDALDRDPTFGETVFRKPTPAGWTTAPGMVLLADAMWVAYLVITVPVITLTRPT
jgi:hypothetical protein